MPDIIDELAGMDDAALGKKLGYTDKIADFRKDLKEAEGLDDKTRKIAADNIKRMFEPNIYPDEVKWKIKDAVRQTKPKTNADCMCENSPASIMDD